MDEADHGASIEDRGAGGSPQGEARQDPFEAGALRREERDGKALIVDVRGFEGPLDLLLSLARTQKVDLTQISILALVEQYLTYIAELRRMRLELAADYLVMAAWLAYLKSRLLLPELPDGDDEPSGEELAAALAFRLRRLEAMREAAAKLMTRNRLGRDVFARGAPEGIRIERHSTYQADLYDLLRAYAGQRQKHAEATYHVHVRQVVTLNEARAILQRLVGEIADWAPLDALLGEYAVGHAPRTSAVASTFTASLEMAREGIIELRQAEAFAPLYMRSKPRQAAE